MKAQAVSRQTVTAEQIHSRLQEHLNTSFLEVEDESHQHAGHAEASPAGGSHFRVRVASPAFAGLGLVAQHRLVYTALSEAMVKGVHALAIEVFEI